MHNVHNKLSVHVSDAMQQCVPECFIFPYLLLNQTSCNITKDMLFLCMFLIILRSLVELQTEPFPLHNKNVQLKSPRQCN